MSKGLRYGVMASIVTIGMLGTTAVWAANTGGNVIQNGNIWAYVGTKVQGSNVHVDSALDPKVTEIIGGVSETGKASSNSLTISGGDFKMFNMIAGGLSGFGEASGNTITITGGNIVMDYSNGFIAGGTGYNSAVNNRVNISGGTIEGIIYGGYIENSGTISDNTVTISGKTILKEASLSGGDSMYGNAVITNNKLVIDNWSRKLRQYRFQESAMEKWRNCSYSY